VAIVGDAGLTRRRSPGYINRMARQATHSAEHVLYVTGPVRERLYARFSGLFQGRADVEVRIDRRVAERRRDQRGPQRGERRSGDRRRVRPEWMVPPPEGT
jgi:hypothetical protein